VGTEDVYSSQVLIALEKADSIKKKKKEEKVSIKKEKKHLLNKVQCIFLKQFRI